MADRGSRGRGDIELWQGHGRYSSTRKSGFWPVSGPATRFPMSLRVEGQACDGAWGPVAAKPYLPFEGDHANA